MNGSLNLAYVMNYAFSGSLHQYVVPPFYQKSPARVILNVEMLLFSFSVSTSLLLLSLEIIRSVIKTLSKKFRPSRHGQYSTKVFVLLLN